MDAAFDTVVTIPLINAHVTLLPRSFGYNGAASSYPSDNRRLCVLIVSYKTDFHTFALIWLSAIASKGFEWLATLADRGQHVHPTPIKQIDAGV